MALAADPGTGQMVLVFELIHNLCLRANRRATLVLRSDVTYTADDIGGVLDRMGIAGCIEIVPKWPEVPPDVLVVDETLRIPGHLGGTLLTAVLFRTEAAEPSGFDSEVYISADLVRANIYPGVDRLRSHSNRDLDQRRSGVARRLRERAGEPGIDQLLTQPFFVSTPWTETPGAFVPAETGLVEAEAYLAGSPTPE
jgi:hypothetical protein